MIRAFLTLLPIIVVLSSGPAFAENSIKLDQIIQNGVTVSGGKLIADQPVEFRFRWTVGDWAIKGGTNGFVLYTYRNGEYTGSRTPSRGQYLDSRLWSSWWDGGAFVGIFGCDGIARDTVKFGGFSIVGSGIPAGLSNQMTAIFSGNLTAGDTLGIDSSFAPPGAVWLWSADHGDVYPDWPGPYLFPVVNCCAYAGDCNFDGSITIADLTTLVRFIFPPHTPLLCDDAANANGSTGTTPINVADVTYMVAHLFRGGPPPVPCE